MLHELKHCDWRVRGRIARPGDESALVRNPNLHRVLETYAVDAAGRLADEAAAGAEMPFELTAERARGRAPLYCYRPLTGEFIRARVGELAKLDSYAAAARALVGCDGLDAYLSEHGVRPTADPRVRGCEALAVFLGSVFCERTGFGFEPAEFEGAYAQLERTLYDGRCTATVIAPVLGAVLKDGVGELALGDGLSLIGAATLHDLPAEIALDDHGGPRLLAILAIEQDGARRAPLRAARAGFAEILSALRLFERGGYAIGPTGWARTGDGNWRAVSVGAGGRPGDPTVIGFEQARELRAFRRLVSSPAPTPELAWALGRFEMGCGRGATLEALTDHLLALRALLEPEGPASGRLAQRLAVICAAQERRAELAQRTARAIALERAAIVGLGAQEAGAGSLVQELSENLRAILRDAFCGHLGPDLVTVADELLGEAAGAPAPHPA
ncbi:MAG: hypothetical protein ACRDMX_11025 [Solirubrobacteraceae bacterium]